MTNKKILIVEDDQDFQDIYALYLQGESFEVIEAKNGAEAIEILKKEIPDLIILDLIMPVMDGEEFYEKLRSEEKWRSIPVIIASANDKTPPKILEIGGISGALRKPFEISHFIKKIKAVLNS